MKLTTHFELAEFLRSSTAARLGLVLEPPAADVARLRTLCAAVLEPMRTRLGRLFVSSGWRSPELNQALKESGHTAAPKSQHLRGEAADLQPLDTDLEHAWAVLVDLADAGVLVDQAIVYQRPKGQGWIHVSCTVDRAPRRELLVQLVDGTTYVDWPEFRGELVLP